MRTRPFARTNQPGDDEAYEAADCTADGLLDVMLQDYDLTEDPALAEAAATIMQKKKKGQGSGQKGQVAPSWSGMSCEAFQDRHFLRELCEAIGRATTNARTRRRRARAMDPRRRRDSRRRRPRPTSLFHGGLELCEHSCCSGGEEAQDVRSAIGHSRQILCKDDACNKAVIHAFRKEPPELSSYLA